MPSLFVMNLSAYRIRFALRSTLLTYTRNRYIILTKGGNNMTETWGKWTICKTKPILEGFELRDKEIHYLGYSVVVVDYYDKNRWDTSGKEFRNIKEYSIEEWEKLKNEKKIMLP